MNFEEQNKADWEEMASYLSGEMNMEERNAFEQRISSSQTNKEYFEQVQTDWELMDDLKEEKEYNADKAWGNLFNKLEEDGLVEAQEVKTKFTFSKLYKIAAIFILGILSASVAYYIVDSSTSSSNLVASTYESGQIQIVELPDGSTVHLNANSKLYYPKSFDGKTRTVEFEGDGFFDIAKNPSKPFIIKAKGAEITVLGTSFNVNTKKDGDQVEVLVETGKVRLSDSKNKNKKVILEPGYMGNLNKQSVTHKKNTDKNYMAWKTRRFDFDGVEFSKTIEILNRAYNVNITFSKDITDKKQTTTFENKTLDEILEIICNTKDLKCKKEGNNIVLSSK